MKRDELERLRALLRDADPAAGVDGPSAEESARLRRRALAELAARDGRDAAGHWARAPRWAFAAAAALLLAAGLALLLRPREGAPGPRSAAEPTRIVAAPASEAPSTAPAPADGEPAAEPATGAGGPPARGAAREPRPPVSPVVREPSPRPAPRPGEADPLAIAVASRRGAPDRPSMASAAGSGNDEAPVDAGEPAATATLAALPAPLGRQIQLTAPGGTRIVWILTPAGP